MSLNSLQGYFNFLPKSTKLRQTLILRLICHEVLECSPPCHVWNARACGTPNKIDYDFWENFLPTKKIEKRDESKKISQKTFMFCSSQIRSVLIDVEYSNYCQNLNICLLFATYFDGANSIKKHIYIFVTYELASL